MRTPFRTIAGAAGLALVITAGAAVDLIAQVGNVILVALDFNKTIVLIENGTERPLGTTDARGGASVALDFNKNYVLLLQQCTRYAIVVEDGDEDRACRRDEAAGTAAGDCRQRCVRAGLIRGGRASLLPRPGLTSGVSAQRAWQWQVLTGWQFGPAARGLLTPPGIADDEPLPNNHFHRPLPTLQIHPYLDDLITVLELLGELGNVGRDPIGIDRAIDRYGMSRSAFTLGFRAGFDLNKTKKTYTGGTGSIGGLGSVRSPGFRVYGEGGWTGYGQHQAFTNGALRSNAESVLGALQNGLLRANPTSVASLDIRSAGGYAGVLNLGGGVERDFSRPIGGFRPAVRVGYLVGIPIGDPRVETLSLNYGFDASAVSFDVADTTTLTVKTGVSRGFDGGVSLSRRLSDRVDAAFDFGVQVRRQTSDIWLSTDPRTSASAQSAVLFSTPPGTRSLLISAIPGLSSTVSVPLENHRLWRANGWGITPVARVGLRF